MAVAGVLALLTTEGWGWGAWYVDVCAYACTRRGVVALATCIASVYEHVLCMRAHTRMHPLTVDTHTHAHTDSRAHMRARTHLHMHACTRTHTHTHTVLHARAVLFVFLTHVTMIPVFPYIIKGFTEWVAVQLRTHTAVCTYLHISACACGTFMAPHIIKGFAE